MGQPIHTDRIPIINNATGPVEFFVKNAPARLGVSGSGTLASYHGNGFDSGEAITGSVTINAPGRYQLTLDAAGYATVQESIK